MKLASRLFLSIMLLAFLALLPSSVSAGMAPGELKVFKPNKAQAELELKDAFEQAKARAEKGDVQAQYSLANYYERGLGVAKDKNEAVKWYRKAADQGHEESKLQLELKDTFEGAEKGDREAQYRLSDYYSHGIGMAMDKNEAVKWCRKAADQGYVQAQYRLGDCYFLGEGVAEDLVEAVKWYRKAADQGYYLAQTMLGDCYTHGKGVAKDEVEAYALYSLAGIKAEDARKNLAILEKGMSPDARIRGQQRTKELQKVILANEAKIAAKQAEDVTMLFAVPVLLPSSAHAGMTPADLKEFEGCKAQAERGDVLAQTELGSFYAIGKGVGKDLVEAVKWYRKAADQGYYLAQTMLGVCYTHGKGVAKDEVEAYALYSLAGIKAEAARKNFAILDMGMSPDARIRGQQRTKELQKEIEAKIAAKKVEDDKKAGK